MSEKKAGFISLTIMLLFVAVVFFASLLYPEVLKYTSYVLSVFGCLWLYRQFVAFILKDEKGKHK